MNTSATVTARVWSPVPDRCLGEGVEADGGEGVGAALPLPVPFTG